MFGIIAAFLLTIFFLLILSENAQNEINNKYDGEVNINGHKFKTESLHRNTDIVYLNGFLKPEECKYIINKTNGKFKRSTIVSYPCSKGRTSYTCFLNKQENINDSMLNNIYSRIASYLNVDSCQIEDLQVVRYNPGQKYDFHYDWFNETHLKNKENRRGGQRLYTIFVYLNNVEENGEDANTCFKNLNICTKPIEGNGVYWTNLKNGIEDMDTLHAGKAPKNGIKYGLNIWVRERCFER